MLDQPYGYLIVPLPVTNHSMQPESVKATAQIQFKLLGYRGRKGRAYTPALLGQFQC